MSRGVASSDIVRSMMRAGFSHEEIYDVLTGVGLPGEQLQLLMDRIAADFHTAKLESRPSQLAVEVERMIRQSQEKMQRELVFRIEASARQLEMIKLEVEKLRNLIMRKGYRFKK